MFIAYYRNSAIASYTEVTLWLSNNELVPPDSPPSLWSSSSVDYHHLFSHQQQLPSSVRHLSLNFWQDLTLVIYLTVWFLCFSEPVSTETRSNLDIYGGGFLYIETLAGLQESIPVCGALLDVLFSDWFFFSLIFLLFPFISLLCSRIHFYVIIGKQDLNKIWISIFDEVDKQRDKHFLGLQCS